MIVELKSANNKVHIISTKNGTYKITRQFKKISIADEDIARLMKNKNLCFKSVSTLKTSTYRKPKKLSFPEKIYLDESSIDLSIDDVVNLELKYYPVDSSLNVIPIIDYDSKLADIGVNNKIVSILAKSKGNTKLIITFNRLKVELNINIFEKSKFEKDYYEIQVNDTLEVNVINGINSEITYSDGCEKISNNKFKFTKTGDYILSTKVRNTNLQTKVHVYETDKSNV